eukprot:CAMPEP_0202869508 /NCGR_PEP_ID=MMETSP1391-20130828/12490_1 /ASSEMBLY_ACC=CAM_ASM_000867 /TAXON_ID=1034604 /ORGANISM="Chlamydomonas leiostraca, Strain SAG 11-49" /LENGTH=662 /DNA_ID=CAMNT_0049549835 /DNA_START=458 /DNA_END=2443 /DNA_ORIENTATION=+
MHGSASSIPEPVAPMAEAIVDAPVSSGTLEQHAAASVSPPSSKAQSQVSTSGQVQSHVPAAPAGKPQTALATGAAGLLATAAAWLQPKAKASAAAASGAQGAAVAADSSNSELCTKIWALCVLAACYVHCAAVTCSIPVLMPMISETLELTDFQSALLTSGHAYLYALALIPMGIIGDKMRDRPKLLAAGVAAWSVLAAVASNAHSFGDLMLARVGLATAQSTQNVVSFSTIPDLFPNNKATAMAFYNTAIYIGRGLMYMLVHAAVNGEGSGSLPLPVSGPMVMTDGAGNLLVPLDKLDLRLVQIVYVVGDTAAIRTVEDFGASVAASGEKLASMGPEVWRDLMVWLGAPGLLLAAALMLTVPEARQERLQRGQPAAAAPPSPSTAAAPALPAAAEAAPPPAATSMALVPAAAVTAPAAAAGAAAADEAAKPGIFSLFKNPVFMAITGAAAMNDVGSYALIAWQSQYYERVMHLTPDQYAPVLATLLPLAGIVGGVGGGLLADRLAARNLRWMVTAGASLLSAPFIWQSLYSDTPNHSFLALGVGFALSEAWRAPSAVIARNAVPQSLQATAMSLYLCIRNVIGGLGPIAVAKLAEGWGLAPAMAVLPATYLASGAIFVIAEQAQKQRQLQEAAQGAARDERAVAGRRMAATMSSDLQGLGG